MRGSQWENLLENRRGVRVGAAFRREACAKHSRLLRDNQSMFVLVREFHEPIPFLRNALRTKRPAIQ